MMQKTQLYISSQSGEVLQLSNRNERFWAWLGAIPPLGVLHLATARRHVVE